MHRSEHSSNPSFEIVLSLRVLKLCIMFGRATQMLQLCLDWQTTSEVIQSDEQLRVLLIHVAIDYWSSDSSVVIDAQLI